MKCGSSRAEQSLRAAWAFWGMLPISLVNSPTRGLGAVLSEKCREGCEKGVLLSLAPNSLRLCVFVVALLCSVWARSSGFKPCLRARAEITSHFAAGPQARWRGASDELYPGRYVRSEQQSQRACGPQPEGARRAGGRLRLCAP